MGHYVAGLPASSLIDFQYILLPTLTYSYFSTGIIPPSPLSWTRTQLRIKMLYQGFNFRLSQSLSFQAKQRG